MLMVNLHQGEPLKLNIYDCDYLIGLLSLYRVAGKLGENTDIGIDRENYRMGLYTFWI